MAPSDYFSWRCTSLALEKTSCNSLLAEQTRWPYNSNLEEEQTQEKSRYSTQTSDSLYTTVRKLQATHNFPNKNKHIILLQQLKPRRTRSIHRRKLVNSKKENGQGKMSLKFWHWHPRGGEMCSRCGRTADWNRHSGLPSRILQQQQQQQQKIQIATSFCASAPIPI